MKVTAIRLDRTAKEKGLEFKKVGDIHDEGQLETGEEVAAEVGKIAVQSITEAGDILKVRERVTGDFKIGDNWSQTH